MVEARRAVHSQQVTSAPAQALTLPGFYSMHTVRAHMRWPICVWATEIKFYKSVEPKN